jgi:hypothetical protein
MARQFKKYMTKSKKKKGTVKNVLMKRKKGKVV